MKKNFVEMVFVLDRSGSMRGKEADTIGGFNGMIEGQKGVEGEAAVTLVLFDDKIDKVYDAVDLKEIPLLTEKEYFVRGCTALLDAVGSTIDSVGKRLSDTPESERPSKVLFVIITDGMENASKEYSLEMVRKMIEHQESKYSWEFLFLGANIYVVQTAGEIGISAGRARSFSTQKMRACYDEIGNWVMACRAAPEIANPFTRVEDMNLSAETYCCLVHSGIHCAEDLTDLTETELRNIHNMTEKKMREVKEKLAKLGYRLKRE